MRRALSLRVTLLGVALAAGVYAAALPLYLFFRVSRPALALGDATEAIAAVGLEVARRDSAIHQVLALARSIPRSPTLRADSLRVAHRLLEIARAPLRVPSGAAIAPALRTALGHTDEALSRVATGLAELVAALDAGRHPEAGGLAALDQLARLADRERAGAGLIAREDLLERQRALREALSAVRRDTLVWLAVGLLFVPALTYVVRRRVWRPLRELEAGLAQVADGDLTVGIPVRGSDELGRLAEHFNAMTRVLRDRAEEQGRFAAAGELLAGIGRASCRERV